MACQKVCKQGRDDARKQRSMYWQSPTPTSFSHYRWTASMRAAAESAPIHAVINAMHKYLSFTH